VAPGLIIQSDFSRKTLALNTTYRGRFAPSPTGPLHFGSLISAVGSYLDARSAGGQWLLRVEDLDAPRCRPEWADDILRTLAAFGFEWDGAVMYQSQRAQFYREAVLALQERRLVYPCACSRREIADSSVRGIDGPVYPGTCRARPFEQRVARALRLRIENARISFTDAIQGSVTQEVEHAVGDFVVQRADGVATYQLAVVVDDAAQEISHVVRGADLLHSTPRQIYLQRLLALPTPHYAHLPVAVNDAGEKLSKQTLAGPVDQRNPVPALAAAFAFLGHPPPREADAISSLWRWGLLKWQIAGVPHLATRQGNIDLADSPGQNPNQTPVASNP
jgi:glutamyl-Q tRNA(Asp) synthetase